MLGIIRPPFVLCHIVWAATQENGWRNGAAAKRMMGIACMQTVCVLSFPVYPYYIIFSQIDNREYLSGYKKSNAIHCTHVALDHSHAVSGKVRPSHRRNPRTDQQTPVNNIRLIYTGVLSIRLHLCGHARGQNMDKRPFRHKKGTPSFLREFRESQ